VSHFATHQLTYTKQYSSFDAELEESLMSENVIGRLAGAACQDEVFWSLRDGHCHVTDPLISKYPL
jgi:hypothetical protein